jgi:hypothetical protein
MHTHMHTHTHPCTRTLSWVRVDKGVKEPVCSRRCGSPPSSLPTQPPVVGISLRRMDRDVREVRADSSWMSVSVCVCVRVCVRVCVYV